MAIEEVRFSPARPTALTFAAGKARGIADAGGIALVRPIHRGEGVFVCRTDHGYEVTPTTLWPPEWMPRLVRILDNFIDD